MQFHRKGGKNTLRSVSQTSTPKLQVQGLCIAIVRSEVQYPRKYPQSHITFYQTTSNIQGLTKSLAVGLNSHVAVLLLNELMAKEDPGRVVVPVHSHGPLEVQGRHGVVPSETVEVSHHGAAYGTISVQPDHILRQLAQLLHTLLQTFQRYSDIVNWRKNSWPVLTLITPFHSDNDQTTTTVISTYIR